MSGTLSERVIGAPIAGTVVALREVSDPVFAEGLLGGGLGIELGEASRAIACTPVAGRVVKLHPHAFIVEASTGAQVLVHLGVDTVELPDDVFHPLVREGDTVVQRQALVSFSPDAIAASGRAATVIVVALDREVDMLVEAGQQVALGDSLFEVY